MELITISEAAEYSSYTTEHIAWLCRTGKVERRKSGAIWLINLDSLKAYEQRMQELGKQKHNPVSGDKP